MWLGEADGKINEAVGMNNFFTVGGGGKRIFRPFISQQFWKIIGFLLSAVTYGKKVQNLWSELPKHYGDIAPTKLRRDVCGNTDLYKVCCDIYHNFFIYNCHLIILSYTTFFIYLIYLWLITSIYPLQVCGISLTGFKEFSFFFRVTSLIRW